MTSSDVEMWPFEPTVRAVVALLARGEYAALARRTRGVRLSAREIRQAVEEYPCRPIVPPLELTPPLDVVEIDTAPGTPRAWSVVVDMWTAEEGRSDLSLELTVRAESGARGGFLIEFDDLHVL